MTEEQGWITVGRAAAIAGVTPHTIRRWMERGIVHGHRTPGGQRRIAAADIQAIREHRPTTRAVPELEHPVFAIDAIANAVGEWTVWKPEGLSRDRTAALVQSCDIAIASIEDILEQLRRHYADLDDRAERFLPPIDTAWLDDEDDKPDNTSDAILDGNG